MKYYLFHLTAGMSLQQLDFDLNQFGLIEIVNQLIDCHGNPSMF